MGDTSVIVPTLNEEEAISEVISGVQDIGEVLVVDGGSTDDTRRIAEDMGVRVIEQEGNGKGKAVRQAIDVIDKDSTEYVLLIDGDGTYRAQDAEKVVEKLKSGADQVIGNRFKGLEEGSMTRLNRIGNGLINWLFYVVNGVYLFDILSGLRGFRYRALEDMNLTSDGFGIETEMAAASVSRGQDIEIVDISYKKRQGSSKLRPLRDGLRILITLYRLTKRSNPLFYFGLFSLVLGFIGVCVGGFVGYEYFFEGVSHQVYALLSAAFILFSSQVLMLAILADLIVSLHEEQVRLLRRITEE